MKKDEFKATLNDKIQEVIEGMQDAINMIEEVKKRCYVEESRNGDTSHFSVKIDEAMIPTKGGFDPIYERLINERLEELYGYVTIKSIHSDMIVERSVRNQTRLCNVDLFDNQPVKVCA